MVINMWTVTFPKKLYHELNEFLFNTTDENGCYLMGNSYEIDGVKNVLITKIVRPEADSWNHSGAHSLEPSSSFINKCVVIADSDNQSPIFVHTHPHALHPPGFSPIDEKSNKRMFDNLSQILPDRPIGSFVFSQRGMCGVIFNNGKIQHVSKIKISGKTLVDQNGIGFNDESDSVEAKFDRQIRVIGEKNQKKIQETTVTIVGVGGTGSPLAVQLSRMGIKKLRLIDMDSVDHTNLPRIYGSKESDVGKPKVDVLKKYLESFSKTQIQALRADVVNDGIVPDIVDSDIIFSCTDNLTSRSILNDISIQYFIPLIDVGCRIHKDRSGAIDQAIMKIQVVTPDTACLWCSHTLDGKLIMQESLSKEEKRKLAEEGYYENVENQPSIISVTTMAASMAVNKLLSLFGIFGDDYNSLTQIELKNGFMIDVEPAIENNCICRKKWGIAKLAK